MRVTRNSAKEILLERTRSGLMGVAFFLNIDLGAWDQKTLNKFYGPMPLKLNEAKRIQRELWECLMPIAGSESQIPPEEAHELLSELIRTLNKSRTKPIELVGLDQKKTRGEKEKYNFHTSGQRLVNLLGYRWVVMPDYGKDLSWQDYFYDMILEALKNNNLSLLKMCGNDNCLRFFVQVDARQGFCNAKCRYEFNNRQRSEKGYFSVRREKRKRSDLNKARRLLQTGKSVMQVVDETGLSKRILERAGLLQGSR